MNDFEGTLSLGPFELLMNRYPRQLHAGIIWFSGLSKRQ
jgi:hypothetical protein